MILDCKVCYSVRHQGHERLPQLKRKEDVIMIDLVQRPRRLRTTPLLRKMVRETRMDKSSLIYPMFVKEGVKY